MFGVSTFFKNFSQQGCIKLLKGNSKNFCALNTILRPFTPLIIRGNISLASNQHSTSNGCQKVCDHRKNLHLKTD